MRRQRLVIDIGLIFGIEIHYEVVRTSGDDICVTTADCAVVGHKVVHIATLLTDPKHRLIHSDLFLVQYTDQLRIIATGSRRSMLRQGSAIYQKAGRFIVRIDAATSLTVEGRCIQLLLINASGRWLTVKGHRFIKQAGSILVITVKCAFLSGKHRRCRMTGRLLISTVGCLLSKNAHRPIKQAGSLFIVKGISLWEATVFWNIGRRSLIAEAMGFRQKAGGFFGIVGDMYLRAVKYRPCVGIPLLLIAAVLKQNTCGIFAVRHSVSIARCVLISCSVCISCSVTIRRTIVLLRISKQISSFRIRSLLLLVHVIMVVSVITGHKAALARIVLLNSVNNAAIFLIDELLDLIHIKWLDTV